ncbi:hypothetical protein C2S52_016433 [Perilla frutescens var. hirtella]|nr:hypothetical protein C2S52_016433 [Perilla frutescens var. hirtella]
MAAAYEALVSLMNTIEQIKNHALISTYFDEERLESVGQRVEFLLDFIEKYSSHGGNDGLQKRIASAANKAEGVIESHIKNQTHADERRRSILLANLQRIVEEMDCIKEETIKVKEERTCQDEQRPASCSTPVAATSWRAHQTRMVGFHEESSQLMDVLTREESSRQIISVVGMGGIGKSTLVRNVFANFITMDHFDVRVWATVTQKYSARGILIDLLVSLKQKAASETVQELGEMLHRVLYNRRYLIVLDDVWDVEIWDEIQLYFPDNNNGSRIVLTTRLSNVATLCNSYCLIRMNSLDEEESWVLFRERVFGCEGFPRELEEVGKEISKLCKGLPLSIVVVGGLLRRSNKTVECWNNVAKNVNSVLMSSDEDDDCYKILSLSYSQLGVHLKPCFVCVGIFEEGREIRASQIMRVWVAAGFIKPNGAQTLEEIAEGHLNELVDRNLVVVGRERLNGKIGSCLVHDLIRAVCLRKSEEDEFFCVGRALGIERERRIICHDFMPSDNTHKIFVVLKFLIFFLIENFRSQPLVVLKLLSHFPLRVMYRLLRVLNMADSSLEAIFKNVNLRFLTYPTYESVVVIPSSVSLIWNLQTLAITHYDSLQRLKNSCQLLAVAPLEIWNLQQLRHVKCYNIYIPDPPPNVRPVVLENLQTLITVVNLTLSEDVCKRIPNVNKLYLKYDDSLPSHHYYSCAHLHHLGSLHKLRSLKLVSSPIYFLIWSSFAAGWRKCTFPTSLKKLKLICCPIDWKDLTRISSLPHLEVLKLQFSMKGYNWSPATGEFLGLKVLSIVNCDLRCWNADSSHFPVLEKLFLESLMHLKEIPLDIGEIPTLELIHVGGCSKSAQISAEKIKEEQQNQGNDCLQIQIQTLFWVERAAQTLNQIQIQRLLFECIEDLWHTISRFRVPSYFSICCFFGVGLTFLYGFFFIRTMLD